MSRITLDECVNTAPQFGCPKIPDVLDEGANEVSSRDVLRRTGYRRTVIHVTIKIQNGFLYKDKLMLAFYHRALTSLCYHWSYRIQKQHSRYEII